MQITEKNSQKKTEQELYSVIKPNQFIIALDEKGKSQTTADLTDLCQKLTVNGKMPTFVIGPADGWSETFKKDADLLLNLGKMTWTYALAHAMVVEQIYRIIQIKKGTGFHRE